MSTFPMLRLPERRSLIGWVGLVLVVALVLTGLLSPVLGPDPQQQQLTRILESPDVSHLFGTDQLGRDQLSRIATGVRNSVMTVAIVFLVAGIGGGLTGVLSGSIGGKFDLILQRLVDAVISMPLVVLVLAVVTATGPSFWTLALSIGVAFSPVTARITRSSALALKHSDYIASAHVSGASKSRIAFKHIVPNAIAPWAIVSTSQAGAAILAEAALAFLGLAPGRITLGGLMGGETQTYMYGAPWLIIWPGVALALLVLSVNLIGEWVSEGARPGTTV